MAFPVKSVGVVGGGVVGHATARSYTEFCDVRVYDIDPRRSTDPLRKVLECDLVFVCLPTPMRADGACDLSYVELFFRDVLSKDTPFVLRSTVPVGTTKSLAEKHGLDIVHSPEFLTARCALVDAQVPSRNIIGYGNVSGNAGNVCAKLYAHRFPGVPLFRMASNSSELVKLICNAFFSTKIAFFNEMRDFSDATHCYWPAVIEAVLADGRIHPSHTNVPGPDGRRGFGGACLPKDLSSVVHQLVELDIPPMMTAAALDRNTLDRFPPPSPSPEEKLA